MKMLLIAAALTVAAPAFAQTPAPAANAHAGHKMPADHADHKMPADQADHDGCCKKDADGKMVCSMQHKEAEGAAADPHAGHDMTSE